MVVVPIMVAAALAIDNFRLRNLLDTTMIPDDVVTVGASQMEPAGAIRDATILGYQLLYPDFKAEFSGFVTDKAEQKTVYLTFDDGPSPRTGEILDVLKAHDVQATFFVNGKSNRYISAALKRSAEEGHEVGMHSYTHRYKTLYASMENLLDDFYRNYMYIKSETGKEPNILRFPGGSINIFNAANYQ
jgi:peptidoglycan/xylan/chitin deacetylase (PgdA/CDA1 family)